jgi:hypothetical protein
MITESIGFYPNLFLPAFFKPKPALTPMQTPDRLWLLGFAATSATGA